MNLDTKNLPPEVAAYIRSLEQKNQQLEKQLVKLQSLNEQLVKMRKRMFGQSSEQIQYVDARQLDLFNEAEVCSDASAPEPGKTTPVKAHARNAKRTKEELTEGLEHKKVVCELPEQERICAKCGSAMVRIGEKFVRSELVIVPAQVYMVDYYAASYKCAHCEAQTGESYIRQAQAPVPVMKKSMAAPSTVAYVMQEKFQNGVPLYRQEAYWKGQGVELRRNTMANWVIRSARWFRPLYELLRKELTASLNRFLRKLPEKDRTVFLLRYYYAGTKEDIARKTGLSSNQVKYILQKVRKQLADTLKKEGLQ